MAAFRVEVNGKDISPALAPILNRITTRDGVGVGSDSAEIEIDDAGGVIVLPRKGAKMRVELQSDGALGMVFSGTVEGVRSTGARGAGRTLTISANGVDVVGKAKSPQTRHFDDMTIGEALSAAAAEAGISDVHVDAKLAAIHRPYMAMQGESFMAFGERLAREVGGTFRLTDDRAVLIARSGGTTASGKALPTITATYGQNLVDWDISPVVSRGHHKSVRATHHDRRAGKMKGVVVEVPGGSGEAVAEVRHPVADEGMALAVASSHAHEAARKSGAGSATILGDTNARPEGKLVVVGTRPGVDGSYKIDTVEHTLDRSGGLVTKLELAEPHGSAGVDDRTA